MEYHHTALAITGIPENMFPEISVYIRNYFNSQPSERGAQCEKLNYSPSYISRWAAFIRYDPDICSVENDCTVYAHPLVFAPLLRTLIQDLANAFPQASFHGSFRLFSSNRGYDAYPFRSDRGRLTWGNEILGSQHPDTLKFWDALEESGYDDLCAMLADMYAPMTGRQLYDAFAILDNLFFDPTQEIQPVDAYYFDNEGVPERESMVDFTHNCFEGYCWEKYKDIWAFFRDIREQFSKKDIPFEFPENFLSALNRRT
jgi:hypothetical protein